MVHWKVKKSHKWLAAAALVALIAVPAAIHYISTPTIAAICHAQGQLPDSTCTPGLTDSRVTQDNIQQTICVQGYTATVRPPLSYTDPVKKRLMQKYGIPRGTTNELDHLIPLELGGDPTSEINLWPEVGTIPNPKDDVENQLHMRVCNGTMTLQDAQSRIAKDWTTALN